MSKLFRSAIGGFKKSDVNNYIVAQNREFDEKKADLEEEITKLKLNIKGLTDKLALAEADMFILRARNEELSEIEAQFTELKEKDSVLEDENTTLKDKQQELESENSTLKEKLAEAEATSLRTSELQAEIARLTEEIAANNLEKASAANEAVCVPANYDTEKDIFSDALANAIISEVILKINSASPKEKVILRRDRIFETFKKNLAEAKARLVNVTKK